MDRLHERRHRHDETWIHAPECALDDRYQEIASNRRSNHRAEGCEQFLLVCERERNGAMVSRGLHLLIGQEVRFEPDKRLPSAAMARLAVRLIHELVQSGPLMFERDFKGPEGEHLLAVPVRDGTQIRILLSGLGNG